MKNTKETIFPKIQELLKSENNSISVRKKLEKEFKLSSRQARRWINQYNKTPVDIEVNSEVESLKDIELSDKYFYNKDDKKYIFFCKKAGKNIVLEQSLVKRLISCYSNLNGDESSISELSLKFNIPKIIVQDVLNCLKFTHSDPPFLPEELVSKSEDELLADLVQDKKFSVYQKYQKQEWQETINKAKKWDELNFGVLKPFEDFVNTWKPKEIKPLSKLSKNNIGKYHFIITLSDLHYGSYVKTDETFRKKEWNTDILEDSVRDYAERIKQDYLDRKSNFNGISIIGLGDFLHGLDGKTHKGTDIEAYPLRQEQFDRAFDSLLDFISKISSLTNNLNIYSVCGNHSALDTVLMKCLKSYFRENKSIKFHIYDSRHALVRIQNVLVAFEHGASLFYKSKVPPKGVGREAYWQKIFSQATPEQLNGIVQKIAIKGDTHSNEWQEYSDFDHFTVGTIVKNDKYAENNNWHSRSKQNAFILDETGVKELLNYYF